MGVYVRYGEINWEISGIVAVGEERLGERIVVKTIKNRELIGCY